MNNRLDKDHGYVEAGPWKDHVPSMVLTLFLSERVFTLPRRTERPLEDWSVLAPPEKLVLRVCAVHGGAWWWSVSSSLSFVHKKFFQSHMGTWGPPSRGG